MAVVMRKHLEGLLVEFDFEFHCAGKIGKSRQTDANAGEDWQTLSRCGCER